MLDKNSLFELARAHAKATMNPTSTFSFGGTQLSAEALNKTFIDELNELGKDAYAFDENKNLIFQIINEAINEILPVKVMQQYSQFAEVKTYGNSDIPRFSIKVTEASRKRAKKFVTKVGLAGRYETFKLDGKEFTVATQAYGGAARAEWEEMLDGRFSLADYYNIVLEGLDDALYQAIAESLEALIGQIKPANRFVSDSFDETEFDNLLAIADTYGKSTIYCTFEFAAKILPQDSRWSDAMKDQIWNNGAFASYKGHNLVMLQQSYTDTENEEKVIDPSFCYIIPTGSEKPVKIALQGGAQTKSFDNRDWSTEIQTYQKMGVATYMTNPGICIYKMTSLIKSHATKYHSSPAWTAPAGTGHNID